MRGKDENGFGPRFSVGWLLLLVGLLHVQSLFNPFFIDDYIYLDTADHLTWASAPKLFDRSTMGEEASGVWWTPHGDLPFYRPIAILTYSAEYQLWGMHAFGYHLTNLLLHLLCTYLVWRFVRRLSSDGTLAMAAATIFAIHPVHSEAVLWISGRFDLLVCATVLSSMLAYLRWRDDGGWRWLGLSVFWFAVGLGCKETAIILPGVLVIVECLRWRGSKATYRWGELAMGACAFGVVGMGYLAQRFALFGGLGTLPPPYGVKLSEPGALGLILFNLAQYALDFAFFVQVDAIYLADFWARHPALLGLTAAGALAVLIGFWKLAGAAREFRVGLVIAAMFTAPALLAMPGERNVYLASVGLALAGATVFVRLLRSPLPWLPGRRAVRVAGGFVALCVVIDVGEHALMWRVAGSAEQVYADLLAQVPNPPPDARIFILNQCPLTAVGFTQGVKLRYGREDVVACALSLSPRLEAATSDGMYQTGPQSLRIVRNDGRFFQSFIERFLLFSTPVSELPESSRRMGIELLATPPSFDHVTSLELRLPRRVDDDSQLLFRWDNTHVRTLADLAWRSSPPRLVRCQPQGDEYSGNSSAAFTSSAGR